MSESGNVRGPTWLFSVDLLGLGAWRLTWAREDLR